MKFTKIFSDCLVYITAAMNLAKRRSYPPSENMWNYRPAENDLEPIEFNMYYSIAAAIFAGSSVGSRIVKPIPLFPGWIGAMIGAGLCGYFCTFRDSRGDLIRYLGNSLVIFLRTVSAAADEVNLWKKVRM